MSTLVILAAIALGIIFISVILNQGRISGQKEEYERIAGKALRLGADPIPERLQKLSFKILSVIRQKEFGNSHQKCIIVCETLPVIAVYDTPETFTFIKWVRNGQTMHEGNAFKISETGELEFNIQPDL